MTAVLAIICLLPSLMATSLSFLILAVFSSSSSSSSWKNSDQNLTYHGGPRSKLAQLLLSIFKKGPRTQNVSEFSDVKKVSTIVQAKISTAKDPKNNWS